MNYVVRNRIILWIHYSMKLFEISNNKSMKWIEYKNKEQLVMNIFLQNRFKFESNIKPEFMKWMITEQLVMNIQNWIKWFEYWISFYLYSKSYSHGNYLHWYEWHIINKFKWFLLFIIEWIIKIEVMIISYNIQYKIEYSTRINHRIAWKFQYIIIN